MHHPLCRINQFIYEAAVKQLMTLITQQSKNIAKIIQQPLIRLNMMVRYQRNCPVLKL